MGFIFFKVALYKVACLTGKRSGVRHHAFRLFGGGMSEGIELYLLSLEGNETALLSIILFRNFANTFSYRIHDKSPSKK